MNPFHDEESVIQSPGNAYMDDDLCEVDLKTEMPHLDLSHDINNRFTFDKSNKNESNNTGICGVPVDESNVKKSSNSKVSAKTLDEVAVQLLEGHFYLTALELHTEIVERGRELPRLRDYFSNPANFEKSMSNNTNNNTTAVKNSPATELSTMHRPAFNSMGDYLGEKVVSGNNLSRAGSASTFDSLDWSHLSDQDNEHGVDRIAVLEFQLRKANDTIRQLRKFLTSSTRSRVKNSESKINNSCDDDLGGDYKRTRVSSSHEVQDPSHLIESNNGQSEVPSTTIDLADEYGYELGEGETSTDGNLSTRIFTSLDSKTLNFVVYEYLQKSGCRLSAISLADELPDQDFEDWDDVGLNTSRPPSLQEIYLKYLEAFSLSLRLRQKNSKTYMDREQQCNLLTDASTPPNSTADVNSDNKSTITKVVVDNTDNRPKSVTITDSENQELSTDISRSSLDHVVDHEQRSVSSKNTDNETANGQEEMQFVKKDGNMKLNEDNIETELFELKSKFESLKHEMNLLQNHNNHLTSKNISLENELIEIQQAISQQNRSVLNSQRGVPDGSEADIEDAKTEENVAEKDEKTEATSNVQTVSTSLFSKRYLILVKNVMFQSNVGSNLDKEHQNILDSVQKGSGDLPHIAQKCLPNLVSNVLLQHRIEAIPLILETVRVHPDQEARVSLLELLFNLIKKPDIRQRYVICQSCVTFAMRVGPGRVEAEVLPLCWGQMNEKHVERRVLVAETATALLPYMEVEIASSLVYSILTQLLDDKEDAVVSAALKGLSLLLCIMKNDEKFDSYLKFIIKYLKSGNESEQIAIRQYMIPCFSFWTMQMNEDLLQNAVFIVVQHLDNLLKESLSSSRSNSINDGGTSGDVVEIPLNSSHNQTRINQSQLEFQSSFICYCATLESFIPFLFLNVIHTSPFAQKQPPSSAKDTDSSSSPLVSQSEELNIFSRFPQAVIAAQDVRSMVNDSTHLAWLINTFDEYLKESVHPEWPQLMWVIDELLPKLIQVLLQLDVNAVPCVNGMSTVCYSLCRVFGRSFTTAKCMPLFKSKLKFDEQNFNNAQFNEVLNGSLVPVFAAGILSTMCDEKNGMKEIGEFVSEMLFLYSVNRAPILSLRAAMIALLSNSTYHAVLTETVYSAGVINTSPQVKLTACHLLELLIKPVNDSLLSNKVMPALITLSGDTDLTVRASTVGCLGSVLVVSSSKEVQDKVMMQLDTLLDDFALHVNAVRMFGRILNNVNERMRIEYIIPRIRSISEQMNQRTSKSVGKDSENLPLCLSLFEFYSSVCTQSVVYPHEVITSWVLPGLRSLKSELSAVNGPPDHVVESVNSLIKEMELVVGGTISGSGVTMPPHNSKANVLGGIKHESNIFSKLKGLAK